MAAFIERYLEDSPPLFRMLEMACASGDTKTLARAAHDLRPHVHYMGARAMLDLLVRIDNDARLEPPVVRTDLVDALLPMVPALQQALQSAIHPNPQP